MASPTPIPHHETRRTSFLDLGGANSLNNFASSFKRTQNYIGGSLVENTLGDDISPCTSPSPRLISSARDSSSSTMSRETDYGAFSATPGTPPTGGSRGYDHINSFIYPVDDEAGTLHRTASKSSIHSRHGVTGSSTSYQTIFNAVNTLMGIAMLSLSFGMRLSGWVAGTVMLMGFSWVTNETAKIIGNILKKYPQASTYGDIAYLYGGKKFQALATSIFVVDLVGASVSLVLLFSDSFHLLFPDVNVGIFKALIICVTFGMSFMPLSLISSFSVSGIFSTMGVLVLIIICGLSSLESPGSLFNTAEMNLWPRSVGELILSLGIFMAPWGGHPVFPELYKDMRNPSKYATCCNITFISTFCLDFLIAAVGYVMFGVKCEDSLTKNVMSATTYPSWVNPLFCIFLGILPVSKLSLVTRPIISVYENYFRMNVQSDIVYKDGQRIYPMTLQKLMARVIFMGMILILSLVFTSFGRVIAFLGSAICFTICFTFPLLFHLGLNSEDLSSTQRLIARTGVVISMTGAFLGTCAALAFQES